MLRIAVRAPSVMIFAFVMAFVVSAKMALIFVVVIPILTLGLFAIIKKARPLFHQVFQRYDVLNQVVREDVRGIRVVKSYVRQDTENVPRNVTDRRASTIRNDFCICNGLCCECKDGADFCSCHSDFSPRIICNY